MPKKISKEFIGSRVRMRFDRCFNLFKLSPHPITANSKSLRQVNIRPSKRALQQKICHTCRVNIKRKSEVKVENTDSGASPKVL